jgi:hypothetical protein
MGSVQQVEMKIERFERAYRLIFFYALILPDNGIDNGAGYFSPKPHILFMTPFLMFRCPATNRQCECDVATDPANLAKAWKTTKHIKYRICGEMHQIKIREAFVDMAMSRDIVITR